MNLFLFPRAQTPGTAMARSVAVGSTIRTLEGPGELGKAWIRPG